MCPWVRWARCGRSAGFSNVLHINNFLLKFNFYEEIPEDKIVADMFFLEW
jgi:hypothetical protein